MITNRLEGEKKVKTGHDACHMLTQFHACMNTKIIRCTNFLEFHSHTIQILFSALTLITNSRWFKNLYKTTSLRSSVGSFFLKHIFSSQNQYSLSAPLSHSLDSVQQKICTGSELNFEFKFKGMCDKCSCMRWIIECKKTSFSLKTRSKRMTQKNKITNSKGLTDKARHINSIFFLRESLALGQRKNIVYTHHKIE